MSKLLEMSDTSSWPEDDSSSVSKFSGDEQMALTAAQCRPCQVVLVRLSKNTLDTYLKRNKSDSEGDEGDVEDEEEDDDMFSEVRIECIDLSGIPEDLHRTSTPKKLIRASNLRMDERIFCLFNLEEFDDRGEAVHAYYRELRYAPFRCLECDEATIELKEMIDHYRSQHPGMLKVQYRIQQVPGKEKWVGKFIDYQVKCMTDKDEMVPNDIVNKYCPVCNQYDFIIRNTSGESDFKVSTTMDMNHIYKHLRYNPYECMLCRKKGRRYAISSVSRKAHEHLAHRHNISSPTPDHLKVHFKPTATIPELENFLAEYIGIIKESERQVTKYAVKRKPLTGKSNRINGNKGRQTTTSSSTTTTPNKGKNNLFNKAASSYKKIKSREPARKGKKAIAKYVAESKEDFDMDEPKAVKDETSKFFCIFCPDKNLPDIYSAWGHYGNHLKYTPIVCQICQKKFTSEQTFRYHGIEHVDEADLPFTRDCDEAIETWGHDFLKGLDNDFEAKPEFASFCPVCEKIFPPPMDIPHLAPNVVKAHVYSHLKYQPYECLKCQGDPSTKFHVGDLDYSAALHLSNAHSITSTPSEIPNNFKRSRAIEALDKLLQDHFSKISYLMGVSIQVTNNMAPIPTILSSTTSLPEPMNPSNPNLPLPAINDVVDSIEPSTVNTLLQALEDTFGSPRLNDLLNNVSTADPSLQVPTTTS